MMDDYLELPLYLEEDETVNLYVYYAPDKMIVIRDVNADPVRYKGWWTISHKFFGKPSTISIEAEKVLYFNSVSSI